MRLVPPEAVLRIVERLEKAGHQAWCVGGAVRDALLGHLHLDWDIATSARPDQVQRIFRRTVPVGVEFGTVGVLDSSGVLHEVTTFRRDVTTDGRHAEVQFGVSLDDDLARRDFTINAIAFSPSTGEVRDPFGGRKDLGRGVVRAVGEPGERMREDRLRALRGIRFAARFGFVLDPATWDAIVESAPHLVRLSAERVRQEIEKTVDQVKTPSAAFVLWQRSGAFGALVPALADAPASQFAAIDHLSRPGLPRRPARHLLRLAALFSNVPSAQLRVVLRDLRFSNNDVSTITRLADAWVTLGAEMQTALSNSAAAGDAQIRRWIAAVGRTQWTLVFRLANAIWCSTRASGTPAPEERAVRSAYRRGIRIAFRDPVELADLAVDGDDLRRAGVAPGPAIGRALASLLERVVEDPSLNQRDVLLSIAAPKGS
jgi:tRNA nucleotidyltransferase (CCA-adding enzyme)